jgi:hypothetical protein
MYPQPIRHRFPGEDDPKYAKLIHLKKLLDGGVMTQEEFDHEKAKILTRP